MENDPLFPEIRTIDDLLPHIEGIDSIIRIDKEDYTVLDYVYMTPDTFPNPYALECRGIKFDKDGNLIARPFHKFFNVGEREETTVEALDWNADWTIMDKLDGSMIHPVLINDNIILMTRKGQSDVALQCVHECYIDEEFMRECLSQGRTPIYEYTSPRNQIVIKYDEPRLNLIAVRDNLTGKYYDVDEYSEFNTFYLSWLGGNDAQSLISQTRALKNKEGYVLRWPNGHMVKIKSDEYVMLHRGLDSMSREKRILDIILEDKLDDLLPLLDDKRKAHVKKYEMAINSLVGLIVGNIISHSAAQRELSPKDFAEHVKNSIDRRFHYLAFSARKKDWTIVQAISEVRSFMRNKLATQAKIDEWRDLIKMDYYDANSD